ncbi:MAG TPA: hypothetical protein VFR58_10775 [Flavisolibacter sp.]|nr:hypothetical protein [Flavisolibacter sp.]
MKRILLFKTILLLLHPFCLIAQEESKAGRISPKELSIPASPVFDLMAVTPSQVTRTSDIKDFKVDWSFKSWRLNPNLAVQGQPIWELFYNRKELTKYQQASPLMRRLSSLDVSIGTVQNEDNDRRIGFATKINLYKAKDPLYEKELYTDIEKKFREEKATLEKELLALQLQLDTISDILQKPGIRTQIATTNEQLLSLNSRRREEINGRASIFVAENWNASSLDLAFGRVYTYSTDSAGTLKNLKLNRNTGWALWLNGGFGIGKKILVTGLLRSTWYEESLDFLLRNKITEEELSQQAVAENRLHTIGLNLRYGGPIYNFFVEFLYEKKALKQPIEALSEAFEVPSEDFEVVASSVKWTTVHPNSFSFGGDWRISRNVIINYGMRCVFNKDWKFETFTPVVSIACMMR